MRSGHFLPAFRLVKEIHE
uniref:Uncharacterized protein tcsA n=1 Tax=Emericella nidulans TaxID=162425 RepID=Q9P897_EMEND|nr:hypothetical protein [Aspergillus nidulans]